jgi:uncharacterized protein (DUF927 family)
LKAEWTPAEVKRYVSTRFERFRHGNGEARGPCPVHQGRDENFSINLQSGMAYCHSRCGTGWDLVGLEAAISGREPKEAFRAVCEIVGRSRGECPSMRRVFVYTDENGKPLREVVRTDFYEPGGKRKEIFQRGYLADGRVTNGVKGIRPVLYRLPDVVRADEVFVVEGEPKVELLRSWGLTATCNAGGAGKFTEEHASALAGKRVVIVPDNDDAGQKHAAHVEELCRSHAREVSIVPLPGLPDKGDIIDWARSGGTVQKLRSLIDQIRQSTPPAESAPYLPLGRSTEAKFISDPEKGVYRVHENGPFYIGPPLSVIARVQDFCDQGCSVWLEFRDWHGKTKRSMLPLKSLLGDGREGLETLLNSGYMPKRDKKAFEGIKDYVYSQNPNKWVRITPRTGLHGRSFVFPDRTIAPDGVEPIVFYADEPPDHNYRTAGTIEDWRDQIGRLCRGNSRLILAVCCAFAGPLLSLLKVPGAGVHFYGPSSIGKTTALFVAGSVCGGGTHSGFVDTWKSTSAGLEVKALLHNSGLMVLDEIALCSPEELGEAVYQLANGTGTNRATRSITARQISRYTVFVLSSGEQRFSDYMQAAGRRTKGGQEARFLDIRADAGGGKGLFEQIPGDLDPRAFSNELRSRALRVYGSPLVSMLEHLTANFERVESFAASTRSSFVQRNVRQKEASGEVFRAAETFGIISAAGELATRLGLTGWKEHEATLVAENCFYSWIDERGGIGARDIERGIEAVFAFIGAQGNARFQDLARPEEKIINRAGFKEGQGNGWTYYILPDVWRNEVCQGYDSQEIARTMIVRRQIVPGEGKHLAMKKRLPGLGQPRVFVVRCESEGDSSSEEVGSVGSVGSEESILVL